MIILLWALNFAVSWLNAWSVGQTWTETRAHGGIPHLLSWCGAIMSAVGFTWCYGVVLVFFATQIPVTIDGVAAPLLTAAQGQVAFDLVYLALVLPLLGSGLAIMTHSWGVYWRRGGIGNAVTAGWNTYANLHNFYSAVEHVPEAWSGVGDTFSGAFSGGGSSDDAKGRALLIMIAIAVLAIVGGIFTTRAILLASAHESALSRRTRYEIED